MSDTSERSQTPLTSKNRFAQEFEEWNDVTGALPKGIGWYYECQSILVDADKEIERLTRERDDIELLRREVVANEAIARRLENERDRLRAALEEVRGCKLATQWGIDPLRAAGIRDGLDITREIAEKALSAETSGDSTLVLRICTAYESGFGQGGRDLTNPYRALTPESEAWNIGWQEGKKRNAEKASGEPNV